MFCWAIIGWFSWVVSSSDILSIWKDQGKQRDQGRGNLCSYVSHWFFVVLDKALLWPSGVRDLPRKRKQARNPTREAKTKQYCKSCFWFMHGTSQKRWISIPSVNFKWIFWVRYKLSSIDKICGITHKQWFPLVPSFLYSEALTVESEWGRLCIIKMLPVFEITAWDYKVSIESWWK